jgi:hypothetical protein
VGQQAIKELSRNTHLRSLLDAALTYLVLGKKAPGVLISQKTSSQPIAKLLPAVFNGRFLEVYFSARLYAAVH